MVLHLTSPVEKGLSIQTICVLLTWKKNLISHFDINKVSTLNEKHSRCATYLPTFYSIFAQGYFLSFWLPVYLVTSRHFEISEERVYHILPSSAEKTPVFTYAGKNWLQSTSSGKKRVQGFWLRMSWTWGSGAPLLWWKFTRYWTAIGDSLQHRKFQAVTKKNVFTLELTQPCNRYHREAVISSSLVISKTLLKKALSNLL